MKYLLLLAIPLMFISAAPQQEVKYFITLEIKSATSVQELTISTDIETYNSVNYGSQIQEGFKRGSLKLTGKSDDIKISVKRKYQEYK